MSIPINPSETFVQFEQGFVTIHFKKPNGRWVQVVLGTKPFRQLSVTSLLPADFRPGGVSLAELLPDSKEEHKGGVTVLIQRALNLLSETEAQLYEAYLELERLGVSAEPHERACAG